MEKRRMKSELTDLRVHNKTLTTKVEELRKEKELGDRASESQRRLLENRTRILLDKNTKSTQKLQVLLARGGSRHAMALTRLCEGEGHVCQRTPLTCGVLRDMWSPLCRVLFMTPHVTPLICRVL